jgi:hypothetical protein
MAQFDVYPHPLEELRDIHPYVLQIQSDFVRSPEARMTIPLARPQADTPPMSRLNPELTVGGEALMLDTLHIVSFEPGDLRRAVANLQSQAQPIWDALEYALHGY